MRVKTGTRLTSRDGHIWTVRSLEHPRPGMVELIDHHGHLLQLKRANLSKHAKKPSLFSRLFRRKHA